ncbi:MAG: hypothetical protein U9Q82_01575 [Chloroflexota bacterium]|nr:hypothetical protein [Chloroflexota bacterium]
MHSWNLYDLYNQLLKQNFELDLQRQMYYQPVRLSVAAAIASERPGVLACLSDDVYNEGMDVLQGEIEEKGGDYVLGSKFNIVEAWAQKPIEEKH